MVLIEQQSTINLNMPLRFLQYINKIYEQIIAQDELNIYRMNRVTMPRPEFICLYNGKDEYPDEKILKLSDSYENMDGHEGIDLELSVRVVNINEGRNESFVKESKVLFDYMTFTTRIRKNVEKRLLLHDAIDEAVKYCIENGILEDFLKKIPFGGDHYVGN